MFNFYNTLVVAPGRKTRGGITAVVSAYESTYVWKRWECFWIESYLDRSNLGKIYYFFRSLFIYLAFLFKASVIHIHFSGVTSLVRKLFYFVPAFVFRKKIIVHFHSFSIEGTIKGKFSWLYWWVFKNANVVIVLSDYWKKAICREWDCSSVNIKVIYNPTVRRETCNDQEKYNYRQCAEACQYKYILYAGTLNKRKGYEDLINSFATICDKIPGSRVVFAGNGEIEKGKALCERLGIANRVEFKGWVSGSQKEELFNKACVFCLPSYAEGFPMAVLDAWAYGLPVVTTPVGGLSDVLKNGENALVFHAGDTGSLATLLEKIITDDELRYSIAIESEILAKTKFDIDIVAKSLDELYGAVTDKQSSIL